MRTEALFASMDSNAESLGRALVDAERKLDRLFATRVVTPERLNSSSSKIGSFQARVRAVHLAARLAQVEMLTPEQKARHAQLRGYGGPHRCRSRRATQALKSADLSINMDAGDKATRTGHVGRQGSEASPWPRIGSIICSSRRRTLTAP